MIYLINCLNYITERRVFCRYNEIKNLYNEPNVNKINKCNRFRWLGYVHRSNGTRVPKKILNGNPEGKRGIGRPKRMWLDAEENDLRTLGRKRR